MTFFKLEIAAVAGAAAAPTAYVDSFFKLSNALRQC
jgi:hypothetical protein